MRILALVPLMLACAGPDFTVGAVEFSAPPGSLAPSVAPLGDGAVLSWTEPIEGGHRVMTAVWGGGRLGEPRPVIASDALFVNWADFATVMPFPDGRWLAHWPQKTAPDTYAYHVMMAVSADSGRTWGAPFRAHGDQSNTEHGFVALAPVDGALAAIWLDGRNMAGHDEGAMTLRFTTVASNGTAAPDDELDGQTCECCQTAMVNAGGTLVAAYRDRSDAEIRDIAVVRRTGDGWSAPAKVHDDGWHYPGCPVNGPQLASSGDTVVVAWFTNANDTARVQAAFSFDAGATFGAPVRIDEGGALGRVAVVWLGGAAAVAWLEETGEEAGSMRLRRVTPAGTVGPAVTFAETEPTRRAGFPRLAVVPEGIFAAWRSPGEQGAVSARVIAVHD